MPKNRFEGFEGLNSIHKPQKKTGKSSDPDYARVTVYLSKDLHYRLRLHKLSGEEDVSELVERVMWEHFKQIDGGNKQ